MAFDATKPEDQGFLADFPPEMREQLRAIIHDAIVNAGQVKGLVPGNGGGNLAVNNGTLNQKLNAAMLEGKGAVAFASAGHTHATATPSSNGLMSNTDKVKLDSVNTGAEVNQNAFANISVGGTVIQADSKSDTLTLAAGKNITLTPDAANDRVTISLSGAVESASAASKLSNARTITLDGKVKAAGVAFDGTKNITLNVTGVTADSCTGNAATATRLSASRIIRLTGNTRGDGSFDGSGNVTIDTTTVSSQCVEEMSARNDFKYLVKACMALNDYFRIGVGGKDGAGYAEIATADEANEPIYVRQYTGMFQNLIRTLTLLDGNGNTSFPGEVSARAFHGNADSASNATKLAGHSIDQIRSFGTQVAVLTGEIANGGTIPLPAGYTEAQCKWMVSTKNSTMEGPEVNHYGLTRVCLVKGRGVRCGVEYRLKATNQLELIAGTANYIIIGVK